MHNPNHSNVESSKPNYNEAEIFKQYIQQDPRYKHLVKLAKEGKSVAPEKQTVLQKIKGLLIANPQDFHGTALVTPELKKEAANTAKMNTAANWFDLVSNFSFWFFLFKSYGVISSVLITLVASGLLLTFCNIAGKGASNRRQGNLALSNTAVGALIALNVVKSLFSGVGIELLLNQSGLNQQMARQLIEEQIQQVEELKTLDDPRYLKTVERCEKGRQELAQMGENHPRRDSLFQELFGTWEDFETKRPWKNVPFEQVPICERIDFLEKQAFGPYEAAKETLNQKLLRRTELGNDLAFLRQEMPQVYASKFQDQGDLSSAEMISGTDAIGIATENFFGKLIRGKWSQISASLFGFSLSIITSTAAVLMTLRYAELEDVKRSRDEKLAKRRDEWLEEIWRQLVGGQDKN